MRSKREFFCDETKKADLQSMITEKMTAVHFPSNALRSKIFKEANGCLLKDRRKAANRFVYSKISHY